MARFRRTTSKGNSYLQYVHFYRNEKGQPATKVLGSLANITNLSEEEIERITLSFIKALAIEERFTMNKYTGQAKDTITEPAFRRQLSGINWV